MTSLTIADPLAMKDLNAFTTLAHRLDPDGAMRLQVSSTVLVVTVAPLYPHGIGDSTPLVLAMRMLRLRGPEQDGLDEVVPLTNLKDRLAREENGTELPVPPNSMLVSWSGIAPPRGEWTQRDRISGDLLRSTASAGIEEISVGAPEGAGSHAVKGLRSRVWSRPMSAADGTELPGGLAFAASGLKFVPESGADEYELMGSKNWLRVVTPGGHLLTRAKS
ncbi:hypothetical protein [Brevibacterium sp. ZH18]|uniref:hypothetical protein n=1 Tax=Brevibacterium sp. ZH18 TaxID=2927784 RepID=UPI001F620F01|nr:hypothetical protein [Brevibacterium sp. ZH18]MCI4009914.1 hypothetical protein [Brevibacterium sp. ZH18]